MFDTSLRNFKDRVGAPLANRMKNINPNLISLIGLAVGLGAAAFATCGQYIWGLALWLLNRILDGLDGLLARSHEKDNDFGGYLDIIFDFIIYAAVPIALVLRSPTEKHYVALSLMLAVFYVNAASWMYLAAILEKRNAKRSERQTTIVMPAGLIGGLETIIVYSLFFLFPSLLYSLFLIFSMLVVITIMQRLFWSNYALR